MKIAFYSTGGIDPSSPFSSRHYLFPRKRTEWDELADMHSGDSIFVYCTRSATHMIDIAGGSLIEASDKISCIFLPITASVEEIADRIAGDGMDVAIAYSLPDVTFDWYPVRDALVGEALKKRGVRVIAHSAEAAQTCLEKWTFQKVLKEHHFHYAEGVYVHSGTFNASRRFPMIRNNVYQEYIRSRIKALHFPVIIKSAAGSGSVGLSVAQNIDEVFARLQEQEFTNDVMVEEKIEGESFGIEIYGDPGGYHVSDPIRFSTGADGITDPFNSIKYGPVLDEVYDVRRLKEELKRLGNALGLCGIAEADMIFGNGKWYILEINPRFSLLSQAVAIMEKRNPFYSLTEIIRPAGERVFLPEKEERFVLDFKSGAFSDEKILEILHSFPQLFHVMRFQYGVPNGTDVSYCEWIIGAEEKEEIIHSLMTIQGKYPDMVSNAVIDNARSLILEKTEE